MFLVSAAVCPRGRLRFRSLRRWPLFVLRLRLRLSLRSHLFRRSPLLPLWLRPLRRRGARLRRHSWAVYLWARLRLSLRTHGNRRGHRLRASPLWLRALHSRLMGLYRGCAVGFSLRLDLLLPERALLLLGCHHLLPCGFALRS